MGVCGVFVVGQDVGVCGVFVVGQDVGVCGVFVGMSESGCGNVQNVCFPFQSYLHDCIPRRHILKTCNL